MPSADGFTCVAVPGGPIGAFKLTAESRMLDCLSTIKDQTMDRHCHFFASIGECQRASASSFKVNDVDDDYSNPNKYWTKARAMLMNQPPATSAPTTSSPPPPVTTAPSTTQHPPPPSPPPPPSTTPPPPDTTTPTTSPPPPLPPPISTSSPPTTSATSLPSTPPPPLPPPPPAIRFETITPDWSCQLHQDKNLYAAAHVVNNTYECLSVGEGGCHYSQTNAECALWLQSENKCWVTGNCTSTIRIKILGPVHLPSTERHPHPPPTSSPPDPSSNDVTVVLLAAIGLGLMLVVFLFWRRRQHLLHHATAASSSHFDWTGTTKAKHTNKQQLVPYQPEAGLLLLPTRARTATTFIQSDNDDGLANHNLQEDEVALAPLDMGNLALWQLDEADLVINKALHVGTRAVVSLATLKHQTVVVKSLNAANATDRRAMQVFVNGMQCLSTLESPYIVTMIGCCWSGGGGPLNVMLVLEYMAWGDLRSYLGSVGAISWQIKRNWAHAISQGLVYLHSMDVVHRAIDAANVLLDSHLHPKLTNVTATSSSSTYTDMATLAPEVLEDAAAVSEASDVYAIGMLLVELDAQQPFDMTGINMDDIDGTWHDRKVAAVAQSFSAKCPPDVQQLALRCVAAEPQDRPNVLEVASALDPYDLASGSRRS
ncbi:TKL protein kinase [Aphanomyces astaci]|uniref:TKL protein kinase n=1 Tax=Aphanomyces astaci TaxID=112090 RepID=W4FHE6_APHAT|nr:TKL protein kinase [Aphanomyces astaci]ETV66284.1 TKL protein kinase [Aphanomyces astaci]|eukprot:XP_009844271.1 TKL protein kinase [Aphanomyces astaci]